MFLQGQLDQEEKSDGEEEKEKEKEQERMSLGSRLSLREEEEEALRSNRVLMALLEEDEEIAPAIGVEEVSRSSFVKEGNNIAT